MRGSAIATWPAEPALFSADIGSPASAPDRSGKKPAVLQPETLSAFKDIKHERPTI